MRRSSISDHFDITQAALWKLMIPSDEGEDISTRVGCASPAHHGSPAVDDLCVLHKSKFGCCELRLHGRDCGFLHA